MFDFIHTHKRLLQFVLALVLIPPFAFWGIESYTRFNTVGEDAALVDDIRITEQEFTTQLRAQQDRLRSLLGGNVDMATLDTPEARRRLLDGMIAQRLLTEHVVRNRMAATDEGLGELIAAQPAFHDETGKFSVQRYRDALKAEGYTPAQFEASVRRDLLVQQLSTAVSEANLVSREVARAWALLAGEKREVAQALVPASAFVGQVKVTPEDVRKYYEANRAQFEVPEQVRVQYVVLNMDSLLAAEEVKPEEARAQYEANIRQYGVPEERQASHILIAVKPGASDEERAKARARAEALAAELKKAPGTFAEAAKKHSDDPGSAGRGGDLGFATRGLFVKPVEDAIFSMKPGEIAGPVESDFGYHILRLTAVRPAKVKPFEEVRAQIEAEIRKQRAGRKFAEAAENFSNMVYEQPDSLDPAAQKFGLEMRDGGWVTRREAKVEELRHPRLLASLFSDDVLVNKRNTEAVEIRPGTVVAARVVEHKPATVRPLEEVRDEVEKRLTQQQAAALAWKEGAQKLEQLKKEGKAVGVSFGAPRTIGREGAEGFSDEVVTAAFKAAGSSLPSYAGVQTPEGYRIVRVSRVTAPDLDDTQLKGTQAELSRDLGERQLGAFVASLRAGADVKINEKLLEKRE